MNQNYYILHIFPYNILLFIFMTA